MNIFVSTIRNNSIYRNNAVVSEASYSPADWTALMAGEEVPTEWDEDGNPIAWDFIEKEAGR